MTPINRWILYVPSAYVPSAGSNGPDPVIVDGGYPGTPLPLVYSVQPGDAEGDTMTLQDLGNGTIALQYFPGYGPDVYGFASVRDDSGFQVKFHDNAGNWITEVTARETLQAIPTGDGNFALYSPTFAMYVTVDSASRTPPPWSPAYPLRATTGDITQAARFTATGVDRPSVLDFVQLGKNVSGLSFAGVSLSNVDLSGYNLSSCDFRGVAQLAGAKLTGAILAATNFTGIDLTHVTFSFPIIRSTDPNNPTIFASCILPYAVIGLDWSYLDLTAATITGLPRDLTGLVAVSVRRPEGDFTGFVLDEANFANATLDGARFTDAKLRQNASFAGAKLVGAYFTGTVLDQANFVGAVLGGIEFAQAVNFSSAWISNCNFTEANAYGVIFAGATLISGNTLTGATSLQESDFTNAYLPYADFTGANLQGAKFDGACMVECVLANADLTPAQQGAISASLYAACLQGVDFTGTKLGGANLTNAAITNGSGQIQVRHYDEYGNLIPPESAPPELISWQAENFPSEASFSNATVCPNGSPYGANQEQGLSIATMMQATNPPTQWMPRNLYKR
jgi:uncharacterized protein YjbI with pentapeptide repeats